MDDLEYAKAKQLRQIAEARETSEPVADFTVRRFADGHATVAVEGSPFEIASLVVMGISDISERDPQVKIALKVLLKAWVEGSL